MKIAKLISSSHRFRMKHGSLLLLFLFFFSCNSQPVCKPKDRTDFIYLNQCIHELGTLANQSYISTHPLSGKIYSKEIVSITKENADQLISYFLHQNGYTRIKIKPSNQYFVISMGDLRRQSLPIILASQGQKPNFPDNYDFYKLIYKVTFRDSLTQILNVIRNGLSKNGNSSADFGSGTIEIIDFGKNLSEIFEKLIKNDAPLKSSKQTRRRRSFFEDHHFDDDSLVLFDQLREVKKYLNQDPSSLNLKLKLADLSLQLGLNESALALYSELLLNNKNDSALWIKHGLASDRLSLQEQALFDFKKAFSLTPENTSLNDLICQSSFKANRINEKEVLSDCTQLKDKNEYDLMSQFYLALIYEQQGDLEQAKIILSAAKNIKTDDTNQKIKIDLHHALERIEATLNAQKNGIKIYSEDDKSFGRLLKNEDLKEINYADVPIYKINTLTREEFQTIFNLEKFTSNLKLTPFFQESFQTGFKILSIDPANKLKNFGFEMNTVLVGLNGHVFTTENVSETLNDKQNKNYNDFLFLKNDRVFLIRFKISD